MQDALTSILRDPDQLGQALLDDVERARAFEAAYDALASREIDLSCNAGESIAGGGGEVIAHAPERRGIGISQ
jgi:hypothetical protein